MISYTLPSTVSFYHIFSHTVLSFTTVCALFVGITLFLSQYYLLYCENSSTFPIDAVNAHVQHSIRTRQINHFQRKECNFATPWVPRCFVSYAPCYWLFCKTYPHVNQGLSQPLINGFLFWIGQNRIFRPYICIHFVHFCFLNISVIYVMRLTVVVTVIN